MLLQKYPSGSVAEARLDSSGRALLEELRTKYADNKSY